MSETTTSNKTNAVAMVAIVMVFFNPLAGLILGHIALAQIKKTGEDGRGAALALVAELSHVGVQQCTQAGGVTRLFLKL